MGWHSYTLGRECECCSRPIADRNKSGLCTLCINDLRTADRDAFTSEWLEGRASRIARDVLRISEGVKL